MKNLFHSLVIRFHAYNRMWKTWKGIKQAGYNRFAKLAWHEMKLNYRVRNQYPCRLISLGFDCMIRTIQTEWMLKPDRRCGEKGMVFDRAGHTAKFVADLIEKDFAGYFDNWKFNHAPEFNCWFNMSQNRKDEALPTDTKSARRKDVILYYHDHDCGPDDLEKLQARTKRRLELFRDTLKHPKAEDLYFLHKRISDDPKDVERVYRLLKEKRGNVPTRMLVIVTNSQDPTVEINGPKTVQCFFPYKDAVWGQAGCRKTKLDMYFSMKFSRICRQFVLDSLAK